MVVISRSDVQLDAGAVDGCVPKRSGSTNYPSRSVKARIHALKKMTGFDRFREADPRLK